MMVPVAAVVCLAVGGPYTWLAYQHYSTFGGVNISVQSVMLFLCVNLVICLWELCLCYKHSLIRATHAKRVKDGQVRERKAKAAALCVSSPTELPSAHHRLNHVSGAVFVFLFVVGVLWQDKSRGGLQQQY